MIRTLFLAALSCAAVSVAQAQQAQQEPTPKEFAMGQRILFELNANVECNSNVVALQRELARVTAELNKLKAPAEPPK